MSADVTRIKANRIFLSPTLPLARDRSSPQSPQRDTFIFVAIHWREYFQCMACDPAWFQESHKSGGKEKNHLCVPCVLKRSGRETCPWEIL